MIAVDRTCAGRAAGAGLTLLLLSPAVPAAAQDAGRTLLVSTRSDGVAGDRPSGTFGIAVAGDGSAVAFSSAASLVGENTDGADDVYVRHLDRQGDTALVLASVTADGVRADGLSLRPSLDGTGDRVAFVSAATNLDAADPDGYADVYVKDLGTGGLVLASVGADGRKGEADSTGASLSADGSAVAFVTRAALLDDDVDTSSDVYVKDLTSGALRLASTTPDGRAVEPGSYGIGRVSLSADGSRVAFDTDARLHVDDADDAPDVYVTDLATGELLHASLSAAGVDSARGAYRPSLAADGRAVAFDSFSADLSPDDVDEDGDVYVKDLGSGALVVASSTTVRGDGSARDASLSGDGRRVAFSSTSSDLDPGDTTTGLDTYVTDLDSGVVLLASSTLEGVAAEALSISPALSSDGLLVAFTTPAEDLGPVDGNGLADVYARHLTAVEPPGPCVSLGATVAGVPHGRTFVVEVTGSARATGPGVASVAIEVADEYGQALPSVAPVQGAGLAEVAFSTALVLPARSRHDDPDGREFTITAVVTDLAGRQVSEHVHINAPR